MDGEVMVLGERSGSLMKNAKGPAKVGLMSRKEEKIDHETKWERMNTGFSLGTIVAFLVMNTTIDSWGYILGTAKTQVISYKFRTSIISKGRTQKARFATP